MDGLGPQPPAFLLGLGFEVLRSKWLRTLANKISYHDTEKYATEDAINIGCLHTSLPFWKENLLEFVMSGGFTPTRYDIRCDESRRLVIWGKEDEVLPKGDREKVKEMVGGEFLELEECGHVPHLEKAEETAEAIVKFVKSM